MDVYFKKEEEWLIPFYDLQTIQVSMLELEDEGEDCKRRSPSMFSGFQFKLGDFVKLSVSNF